MSQRATPASFALALALALVGFGLLTWHFRFVCDDAYITFRYARNLAEGRGLVFNPGDVPPVEGYSNLLWTLVLAGCHALGATGTTLGTVANLISAACGALLLALVLRVAVRRMHTGALATVATGLFAGTLAPLALWSTSGLETMPFTLALFGVFERLEGDPDRPRPVQAGLIAMAAALLRADGFLWLAVVLGLVGLGVVTRRGAAAAGRSGMLRALLITGGLAAVAIAGQFLWRHGYYGEWMPNTAKVKTGFSDLRLERGLKYLGSLALAVPALALVPALATLERGTRPRSGRDGERGGGLALRALGVLAVGCAYSVYVGGDFMPMGRFLVPALPFLVLLFAYGVEGLARRSTALAAVPAGLLVALGPLVALDVVRAPDPWLQALHFRWNSAEARTEYAQWELQKGQAERWAWLGRALALYTKAGESIIRGPVGAIGYFSELEVLDMNGLVTLAVAEREAEPQRVSPGHDKHVDPDFFFPMRPTFLGAGLLPAGAPDTADLSPAVVEIMRRGLAVMEKHRLRPKDGFPRGLELRLFRFRWPD